MRTGRVGSTELSGMVAQSSTSRLVSWGKTLFIWIIWCLDTITAKNAVYAVYLCRIFAVFFVRKWRIFRPLFARCARYPAYARLFLPYFSCIFRPLMVCICIYVVYFWRIFGVCVLRTMSSIYSHLVWSRRIVRVNVSSYF